MHLIVPVQLICTNNLGSQLVSVDGSPFSVHFNNLMLDVLQSFKLRDGFFQGPGGRALNTY